MTADPNASVPQRAFSIKQIAAMLDVPTEQARMLVVRGELDHFRVGKHIRVPDFEFERYLRARTSSGTAA